MSDWAEVARREGFAYCPGLLDAAVITSLRDAVLASLAQHGLANVVAVQCDIMPLELVGSLRNDHHLRGALSAILEAEPVPIRADVLRIVGPGEAHTPPHKDADYLSQDPLWIAWIPLDCCPMERGPLVVNASTSPQPLPCSIGDVIFFSSQTVHATLPNTSGATRLSIDFRFTN